MTSDDAALDELESRLDAIALVIDEDPAQALTLAREAVAKYPDEPDALALLVETLNENDRLDEARDLLQARIEQQPEDAEARYLLGMVYLELDEPAEAARQMLAVRRLDVAEDEADGIDWQEYEGIVAEAAEDVLRSLPSPFKERLQDVPVLIEDRPGEAIVREGFDPRALGLFEGRTDEQTQNNEIAEQPTRIVLYVANLVSACDDEDELEEQVAITLLHEMGHYYNLEEEDMGRLGLE
jgi:predicted Zn-dependent protease with MMP-like domain